MDNNVEAFHAYGSTVMNPSNDPHQERPVSDVDIQLNDFKGLGFNEKGDLNSQLSRDNHNEKSSATRPTSLHALLNNQSSGDRHSIYSDSSFDHTESWIRHPKVLENWRIVLVSGLLSLLGLALVATSIVIAITPQRGYHCLIIGLIGVLCVIPGGYHFIYIYCAAIGRPGYYFGNLPVLR